MKALKKAMFAVLAAALCTVPAFADVVVVRNDTALTAAVLTVVVIVIVVVLLLRRMLARRRGADRFEAGPAADTKTATAAAADAAEQFLTQEADSASDFGDEIASGAETGAEGADPGTEGSGGEAGAE